MKPAKKGKKQLQSLAFVVLDPQSHILLRTRPAKGLLADMAEVPNAEWSAEAPGLQVAPFRAEWQRLNQPVIHIFTHIDLRMEIAVSRLSAAMPAPQGMRWVAVNALDGEPVPTLFRKVIEAGLRALG